MHQYPFIEMDFNLKVDEHDLWNNLVDTIFNDFINSVKNPVRSNGSAKKAFSAILLNLHHIYIASNETRSWCILYSRAKGAYKGKFPGHNLTIRIVDWMQEEGLCEGIKGFYDRRPGGSGRKSRLRYTPELASKFYALGGVVAPFRETDYLIRIKDNGKSLRPEFNKMLQVVFESRIDGDASHLDKLKLINDVRRKCRLTHLRKRLPVHDIYRVYNNSGLGEGGRFYGCFVQGQPSRVRSEIEIDGGRVVELDFSSLHPTLLYDIKGIPAVGGLYDVDGYDREIVKQALLRILNNRESTVLLSIKKLLREKRPAERINASDLISDIRKKHEDIDLTDEDSCIGLKLQRIDSDIAMEVMFHFAEKRVPCFCVHDSFIVPVEFKEELKQVMVKKYTEVVQLEYAKSYERGTGHVCWESVWRKKTFSPVIK